MTTPSPATGATRNCRHWRRQNAEWWDERTAPEPNTGCLFWLGTVCSAGYGHVSKKQGDGEQLAHRVAYRRAFGPFDAALDVCHSCDNPSCVNADHLFLGTHKDNMRDMYSKGRGRPFGLPLNKEMSDWRQSEVTTTVATGA